MTDNKTREYQAAMSLEDALNDTCWKPKQFAEATLHYHPTLQATLIRTIVEILKLHANPERYTDARNDAAKQVSQKLMEVLNDSYLPYI